MNAGLLRAKQRGAVSVLFVLLFLVAVGYAAVTSSTLVSTGLNESQVSDNALKAELLAQSGLERAFRLIKTGTACTSLGSDPAQTYGAGTFDVTAGVSTTNGCQVTVLGTVGSVQRTRKGTLHTETYVPFASATDFSNNWSAATYTISPSRGSDAWDAANCTSAVCTGSSGGSYYLMTGTTGAGDSYVGYRERVMTSISTGGGGKTVNWSLGWKKFYNNTGAFAGTVLAQSITVSLVDTGAGVVTTLWTHTATNNTNSWALASGSTALPANRTYDRIRVTFDLQESKKAVIEAWIDEIKIQ